MKDHEMQNTHDLLECYEKLTKLFSSPDSCRADLLQCAVNLISSGFNFPERTRAKIIYDDRIYANPTNISGDETLLISMNLGNHPVNRLEIYRCTNGKEQPEWNLSDTEKKHLLVISRLILLLGEYDSRIRNKRKRESIAAGPTPSEDPAPFFYEPFPESEELNGEFAAFNDPKFSDRDNPDEMAKLFKEELRKKGVIEQKLRLERKRLYSVLDKIPASIHLVSADHKIRFANKMFMDQFGACLTKSCHEILYNSGQPCAECKTFKVFEKNDLGVHESVRSNGRIYRIYNYPFVDMDGTTLILQLGVDITERKKAEDDLRKSEQRFRSLVNSVDDTVYTLNTEYKFVEIYGSLFEKLGYRYSQCLDKPFYSVFKSGRESIHKDALAKSIGGENVIYEWSTVHRGEVHHIQSSVSPLYNGEGQISGVVGIARDITHYKTLENQSVQTEKLMAVAELSAMISHEFRNALTSVKMILELQLESEHMDKSEAESLSVALSSISHMEDIVRQLLNFTRPLPIRLENDHVNEVIETSLKLIKSQVNKYNIQLSTKLSRTIPSFPVDRIHLQEAIVNILLNGIHALKDKPDGKLRVVSRVIKLKTDLIDDYGVDKNIKNKTFLTEQFNFGINSGTDCVLIEIKDNGEGIKKDVQKRIFDPFFTMKHTGTGLGLAVVRRTIQSHHGIIKVKSSKARGTVFSIYIPI